MNWLVDGDLVTADIDGYQNVVVQVPWVCQANSEGITINMHGKTDLAYNSSSPFIQYDDLTQNEVIGWVKDALGVDGVTFYETKTQEQLDIEVANPDRGGTVFECWTTYVPVQKKPAPWSGGV